MTRIVWKKLPVTVIGLGKSGAASANFLAGLGAKVLVSESKPEKDVKDFVQKLDRRVSCEFGGHSEKVLSAKLIVKSPGVPHDLPVLKAAHKKRIPIWSELELASRFIRPKKLVAITGTNGKTTATLMTSRIFETAGWPTVTAGNIGTPLCDLIERVDRCTAVVLEVSSYQLEDIHAFRPDAAVLLNVTPDHLEHHGTMARYAAAKARIFENQTSSQVFVYNADDKICQKLAQKARSRKIPISTHGSLKQGLYYEGNALVFSRSQGKIRFDCPLLVPGRHNRENALAAAAAALVCGVKPDAVRNALTTFPGVEHRIENIGVHQGMTFYNDSKATNVDSTLIALQALESNSIRLILGGRDKGAPYTPLFPWVKKKVREILTIGEAAPIIEKAFLGRVSVVSAKDLVGVLNHVYETAREGDLVLLSPACASFDQFQNFEHRGRVFKELVRKLDFGS